MVRHAPKPYGPFSADLGMRRETIVRRDIVGRKHERSNAVRRHLQQLKERPRRLGEDVGGRAGPDDNSDGSFRAEVEQGGVQRQTGPVQPRQV